MDIIKKIIAVIMIILGIAIILEYYNYYTISIPQQLLIAAILMIILQIYSAVSLTIHSGHIGIINIITWIIFCIPAIWYLLHIILNIQITENLPLILSIMMIGESLYALH
ncbi:MAG: hypothetical protein ACMXYG_00335 [Candidatus Woesearchaeota archaeon]